QREIEWLLWASAQDRLGGASDTAGWDQFHGYGRLNALYAVQMAAQQTPLPLPLNLSTRGFVATGEGVMIAGLILNGVHAKNVIVRAIGPSLSARGVNGALQDPALELYDASGALVASSFSWRESQLDVVATGLAPGDDREPAIVRILQPGAYTAIVRGTGGSTGVALVEAYDLQQTPNSRLANISTRGFVAGGDSVLIGGFITGAPSRYVLRAIGPSLRNAGLTNPLSDPRLQLYDANGALRAANDDWQSDPNSSRVQSLGLAPSHPQESALFVELPSGPQTAIVRGTDGTSGIGLVEVYAVQ
ncbi:MAG TPA: hypothetical protein VG095_08455, partial [Chthoniobacterales bacterium]|nr:hypothetical protein [Chthoniobacterales bacterium]